MWHCAPMAADRPPLEMPSFSLRRRRKASEREPARVPSTRRLPTVPVRGLPAAVLAGVVVGVLAMLLGWLAGAGCEAVRGTSACGRGPGLLILLLVLAALTWAGSLLLRVLGVPHAMSTSLLAVGILAVLVLVLLLDSLDQGWALVAVPVASAVAHAVSWWVTTAVGDDDETAGTSASASSYDVR